MPCESKLNCEGVVYVLALNDSGNVRVPRYLIVCMSAAKGWGDMLDISGQQ